MPSATVLGMLRWRLIFAILGCIGMAIIYGLKVNLHTNIVAMVNNTALHMQKTKDGYTKDNLDKNSNVSISESSKTESEVSYTKCYDNTKSKFATNLTVQDYGDYETKEGPFIWDGYVQGIVLGSYFYGYLVTQVPGGRLAELYSGKWVFFTAVMMNIVPTLLSPMAAYAHWSTLVVLRVIEGLGGGVTLPSMNVLISKWAPKEERSTLASICYGGMAIGTVISISTAGLIAGTPALGWEGVFYIHGGLSCIWCLLWIMFVTDSPSNHPYISDKERVLIETSLNAGKNKGASKIPPLPYKRILSSIPFWGLFISHFLNNFGWYMLLVELPTFLSSGLGYNIEANALLSCLPFLCNWIFSIIWSTSIDHVRRNGWISTTAARKVSTAVATLVPAACLVAICHSGCDSTAVVFLLVIAVGAFGAMFSGILSNHVDIASNFAGILMGTTNMFATIPGCLVPIVVAGLTQGSNGLEPWHTVFYLTAGMLFMEFVVFTIMASGHEQSWNRVHRDENAVNKEEMTALKTLGVD